MTDDRIDVEVTKEAGVLTIDGLLMHRPAFAVVDVTPLWEGPEQRGDDLTIPGRPGALANPRRADKSKRQLRMLIDGRYDVAGTEVGDPIANLYVVRTYLRTHVSDPTNLGDGTRALVLTVPSGPTLHGSAHLSITFGSQAGPVMRALLEVSLPDGALVPA